MKLSKMSSTIRPMLLVLNAVYRAMVVFDKSFLDFEGVIRHFSRWYYCISFGGLRKL